MNRLAARCKIPNLSVPRAVASLLIFLHVLTAAAVTNSAAPARHKIFVRDPLIANELIAQNARLVADYGTFKLFESAGALSPAIAGNGIELRDELNLIQLNTGHLDTSRAAIQALRSPVQRFAGKRMHLVQFAGPIKPEWRESLLAAGVEIVAYIPHNAYLLYGDASALAQIQALAAAAPHVQWDGAYRDEYRIHPNARAVDRFGNPRDIGTETFSIQLFNDPDANSATMQLLDQLKLEPLKPAQKVLQYVNVVARLSPSDLPIIAARPDVVSIQPNFPPRKVCERQDRIISGYVSNGVPTGPGYLAWLTSKGFNQSQFTASGFTVDLSDSGLDNGTTYPNHFGLHVLGVLTNASRVAYCRLEGTPNMGSVLVGCDGHGTLNGHIIGGYNDLSGFPHTDAEGFHYGLGVCPFVRVGASVIFDPDDFTWPNINNLQADAYASGARISNNSWGDGDDGLYGTFSQNYDALVRDAQPDGSTHPTPGNQEMVIVFAAGNVMSAGRVAQPGNAKNVVDVGASENVQAFGSPDSDGSGVYDSHADNADDVAFFSDHGPCADGRHKPDLMAPGTHVSGGVAQAANPGPTGTRDPCYSGSQISGGPDAYPYYPTNQEFYTASSGTSFAAPAVSGACALLRQSFINAGAAPPSPAMTKAFLMNSARYLTGWSAGDSLWSDNQGMGELNLGMALDGTARILRDQLASDLFTNTGQSRVFMGVITDTNKPLRVTLAWTDAPGSTTSSAFNNDLDLVVIAGGITYKGNVFLGPWSLPGGTADGTNNVESVILPAGTSGNVVIQIIAANINSDGVPNNSYPLDQDFALVAYNMAMATNPVIIAANSTLLAESCQPTNGVVDPGETVTLRFSLKNIGGVATTNLVATLQANGGVISPSGPQNYGALPPGGFSADRSFTFTADGNCGSSVKATLQLNDGAANLGLAKFTVALGQASAAITYIENFDGVAVPELPAGWTVSSSAGSPSWSNSSDAADTTPNAAFIPDTENPGTCELVSPPIPIVTASAQLTFQQNYDLETDYSVPKARDGGVLEIKIGTNAFVDVLEAGCTFGQGAYNMTVSTGGGNPFGGRPAWGGYSGGFRPTTLNLPTWAAGQNMQLKWRLGTDSMNPYGGGAGWYVDSLSLLDGYYTCCSSVLPPSIASGPSNQTVVIGSTASFQVNATGTAPLNYQWLFNGTNFPGSISTNNLLFTNVQPSRMGGYSVIVTNSAGAATSAIAALKVLVWPSISHIDVHPTNTTIKFGSVAGLSYVLQYKNTLSETQWNTLLYPAQGTGGTLTLSDTNYASSRYYRVRCY